MTETPRLLIFACAVVALVGCHRSGSLADDAIVYTLYRNSAVNESMRIHVATFDATETEKYNLENCNTARDLWAASIAPVKSPVRYCCEKGRFRP